jgi:acetylornithine deacetylase/succinyl-diaminopimelate desuccinylase-like protein
MTHAVDRQTGIHQRPDELLRELIRFDTTNPPGNERECISYIDRLLSAAGLETITRGREPERPNLVARLQGRGSAPPLLVYGHVDVVTTEGQQWTHPPFEGKLVDGWIWGRGALDMKGGVAMMLAALLRAAEDESPPPGDVIFCALADEEAFGGYGARFMVGQHAQLFAGVQHAIGEFGGFALELGSRRFYPIQVAEKQLCTLIIRLRGPGGHGALPIHGGAMAKLARALERIDRGRLPTHVTPVVRDMCRAIGKESSLPMRLALRLLLTPPFTNRLLGMLGARGHELDPLLHNTVSPTMVRASDKVNVIPSEVSLICDGRLLPGFEPDDLIAELRAKLPKDVEIEVFQHEPGPATADMGFFETLANVLRELDPDGVPIPLLMAGVTDARFFAQLGIQTYGFTPMNLPPGFNFWSTVHGADERVPAKALEFGTKAIHRAMQRSSEAAGRA